MEKIRYLIDAVLFVNFCATAIVGVMLGYLIPEGVAADAENYFLWLHRNDWGDIHLFLSTALLVIVGLHLVLNIGWIARTTKAYFGTFWLKFLGLLAFGWVIVLLISWFAVRT